MDSAQRFRAFIIDDDPKFRKILAYHVSHLPNFEVCGQAEDLRASKKMVSTLRPDLVLIDLLGFEGSQGGIEIIKALRMQNRQLPILAVSMSDPQIYASVALSAGANGFLWKEEIETQLQIALEKTMKKESYVSH